MQHEERARSSSPCNACRSLESVCHLENQCLPCPHPIKGSLHMSMFDGPHLLHLADTDSLVPSCRAQEADESRALLLKGGQKHGGCSIQSSGGWQSSWRERLALGSSVSLHAPLRSGGGLEVDRKGKHDQLWNSMFQRFWKQEGLGFPLVDSKLSDDRAYV